MYSVASYLRKFLNALVLLCTGRSEHGTLSEEHYRQRILVLTSCFWLLTVIFLTLVTPLIIDMTPEGQRAANILFVFTAVGVVGSMFILRITGSRIVAGNVMLLIYTGAFAGACLYLGGSASPTYVLMMLAPVMAGIIGSVAMSIGWGLLVLLWWVGILIAEQAGFQFTQVMDPDNKGIAILITTATLSLAIVAVILIYAEMNKALRTSLIDSNAELEHLSSHDQLTRLPNRRFYDNRMGKALRRAAKRETQLALMLIDLNDFKRINDTHGHGVGDKLLIAAAQRLRSNLRETDLTARLGGDEFVVVLEDIESVEEVTRIAGKLADAIEQPLTVRQRQLAFSASIGVALFPGDGRRKQELEEKADKAMYHAKKRGIAVALYNLESAKVPTPVRPINQA